eukprot:COSAG02_NODE_830_length_16689_cov_10.438999_7_plen_121_part_00
MAEGEGEVVVEGEGEGEVVGGGEEVGGTEAAAAVGISAVGMEEDEEVRERLANPWLPLAACLAVCLPGWLYVGLPACLCLRVCLSVCLSVCLYVAILSLSPGGGGRGSESERGSLATQPL